MCFLDCCEVFLGLGLAVPTLFWVFLGVVNAVSGLFLGLFWGWSGVVVGLVWVVWGVSESCLDVSGIFWICSLAFPAMSLHVFVLCFWRCFDCFVFVVSGCCQRCCWFASVSVLGLFGGLFGKCSVVFLDVSDVVGVRVRGCLVVFLNVSGGGLSGWLLDLLLGVLPLSVLGFSGLCAWCFWLCSEFSGVGP